MVGSFEVKDWDHWKKSFDAHKEPREAAGIKTVYVGNEIDNPNKVHIVMDTPQQIQCKNLCKTQIMLK